MFVDIEKAVKDLKKHDDDEDAVELRYHVMRGEVSAYIKTPTIYTTPGYNDEADIFRVPSCPLDSFFDRRLSEYCKIVDPVWKDGRISFTTIVISFTTIVVTDLEGKSPTRKNPRYTGMSNPSGKIGPGGKVTLYQGWTCDEKALQFDEEEIQRYAVTKKEISKKNELLRKFYPQLEIVWNAMAIERAKKSFLEGVIVAGIAERDRRKFKEIKKKYFEDEVLKKRLASENKAKREFIGTMLQLIFRDAGSAADYQKLYEEAQKLIKVPQ